MAGNYPVNLILPFSAKTATDTSGIVMSCH
jgi:hypothetical protein